MTYTIPTTRIDGLKEPASDFNRDVIENIQALYNPPTNAYRVNEGSEYTTSSTSNEVKAAITRPPPPRLSTWTAARRRPTRRSV